MRIRKRVLTAGGVALAGGAVALGGAGTGVAQVPDDGVEGDFSLIQMVHTAESTPNFAAPATRPWNGTRTPNIRYTYRSIPCTGAAPVNNIASDLPSYGARVQGSRAPSSMRAHPFRIRLRKSKEGGWEMLGRIVFTVCKLSGGPTPASDPIPDAEKPKIYANFKARFKKRSVENLHWSGTFELVGGTQRYRGLRGSGSIAGYFFCFNPEGCVNTGRQFRDGQMVMHGSYEDATPQLRD